MERLGEFLLVFGGLYVIIFIFVMMGSRNFFSKREIISNPAAVAGVIWVVVVLAVFWNAFWGPSAGIAFVALLIIVACAIAGLVGWLNRSP
jgi:hypothetical protein